MSIQTANPLHVINPVIMFVDNMLRVHRLINIDSLPYYVAGKPNEELPSTLYQEDVFDACLKHQIKFIVEATMNLDPAKLKIYQDYGTLKWYVPKYMEDRIQEERYDVKVCSSKNIKKVKFLTISLSEIQALPEKGLSLLLLYGALPKKVAKELGLKKVQGQNFSYFKKG